MATNTTNYNLKKPEDTDNADLKVFVGDNMDSIDSALTNKLDKTGNSVSASKLATSRNIALSGDVSGSTTFDGSSNVTITTTVADDSHNHIISNVDGLQTALDGKETPSGAQSKADTAETNAINFAKSYGLGSSANLLANGTDVNTIKTTGFYRVNAGVNVPPRVSGDNTGIWHYIIVIEHDTSWVVQNAFEYSTGTMFVRALNGGNWTPWKKHWDDSNFNPSSKLDAGANAVSASKLVTARSIALSGDVSGSTSFDGSGNVTISTTVADDSHNHIISNIDGLQSALDGKETPSGAQTKANTAETNAINYAKSYGLGTKGYRLASGYDLNTLRDNGWYDVSSPTNGISGLGWHNILVVSSGDQNYVTQVVFGMTSQQGTMWVRTLSSGTTWTPWRKHWDDSNFNPSNYLGVSANAVSASKLATARTISLGGDLSGSSLFDGSSNITISASVADDSHNHIISNIDGLQSLLNSKIGESVVIDTGMTLNGVTTSGFYRLSTSHANAPTDTDVSYGQMIVSSGSDSILQIVTGYNNNEYYMRQANGIGGSTQYWQPWRKLFHNGNFDPNSKLSTTQSGSTIQTGNLAVWEADSTRLMGTQTFPVAFSVTPMVSCTINWMDSASPSLMASVYIKDVSTTQFTVGIVNKYGSSFTSGIGIWMNWIAVG